MIRYPGRSAAGGLLGGDTGTDQERTPVFVDGLDDAVDLAYGEYHGCAIRAGGQIVCWGENTFGGIGDGTTDGPRTAPVAVSGL